MTRHPARLTLSFIGSLVALVLSLATPAFATSASGASAVKATSSTAKVIATISIGATPVAVAVNLTTNQIYVLRPDDNVSVIDGTSDQVIATIPLPTSVYGCCFSYGSVWSSNVVDPTSNLVFVLGSENYIDTEYSGGSDVELVKIDGSSNTVVDSRILLQFYPGGGAAGGIDVNPKTHLFYATEYGLAYNSCNSYPYKCQRFYEPTLESVDETTDVGVAGAGAGFNPGAVAVNVATDRIYVATVNQTGAASVDVVSGAGNKVVATIPLPAQPGSVAANAKTNRVYADYRPAAGGGAVAALDGATNQVIATISLDGTGGLAVNPAANRIYATDGLTSLWIIDGATNAVLTSATVGNGAGAVATDPLTGRVYVTNGTDNTISVVQD
jgi:YVTN family beta-propeller protein